MAYPTQTNDRGTTLGQMLTLLAYPRLREFPPGQRQGALDRARNTAFDALEWVGIAAGVAVATFALRPLAGGIDSLVIRQLGQFALALPLVAALVGPFLLRRTRRGLDMELVQHNGGESWNPVYDRRDEPSRRPASVRPE